MDGSAYEDELQQIIDSNESRVAALILASLIAEYGLQSSGFKISNAVKSLSNLMKKSKFSNGLDDSMTAAVIASLHLLKENVIPAAVSMHDVAKKYVESAVSQAANYYDDDKFSDVSKSVTATLERSARISARWMIRNAIFQAQSEVAKVYGFTKKRWVSRGDTRVRHSHSYLDGQTVAIGSSFNLPNGGSIRFPGDFSAPIEETANCRCVVVFE